MKIANLLFVYKRSEHTARVLEALSRNTILPQKLIIFQDGLRDDKDICEWNKVNRLINSIDWCDHEVFVSAYNQGLADAVVTGVNYVFQEYDAVIVLEDDCVTHPAFMTFMLQALIQYQNKKDVYSVSGYAYPVDVQSNGTDAYFTKRISSWGWGTWKDRWIYYQRDYRMLGRIMNNAGLEKDLHIWGADLENYVRGNIYGTYNSWAAFWALTVIERHGYCLSPYKSLLRNIGLDGTGVHCGSAELIQHLYDEKRFSFLLPEEIKIPDDCEQTFTDYFSWTRPEKRLGLYNDFLIRWVDSATNKQFKLAERLIKNGISKCVIWGKGKLCDLLMKELEDRIQILSIIESRPVEKEYRGIPVVGVKDIPEEAQLIIVIPIHDFSKIEKMAKEITRCRIISLEKILDM